MTIVDVNVMEDGLSNAGDTGEIAVTANPWTFRVRFLGQEGAYLVGFFDTLAHALASLSAAQAAAQFGAAATAATITTWMGTTVPQTGFVATRTYTNGGAIGDQYLTGGPNVSMN
jgi:hypothetical protein